MHSLGCAVVHNNEVIETLAGRPALAFAVHENHAYFYSSKLVRNKLVG